MGEICDWTKDTGYKSPISTKAERWESTCGRGYVLPEKGVAENGFRHCPFCGGKIRAFQTPEERNNTHRNEDVYNQWICSGCRMEVQYQCQRTGEWYTTRFPMQHFLNKDNLRLVPEGEGI